jgi:hypothetical protein
MCINVLTVYYCFLSLANVRKNEKYNVYWGRTLTTHKEIGRTGLMLFDNIKFAPASNMDVPVRNNEID